MNLSNNLIIKPKDNFFENQFSYILSTTFERDKDSFGVVNRELETSAIMISSNPFEFSSKAAQMMSRIRSFEELEDDWNSYGAAKPSTIAIRQSIDFVKRLDREAEEVFFTAPGPDGEILVELKNNNKSVEFFFYDDETTEFTAFKGDDCEKEGEINDIVDYHRILVWLNLSV